MQARKLLVKLRNLSVKFIPDAIFIRILYFRHFKKFPNLKNPKSFNEKLQWLKLHDRKDQYTTMVDKYLVKDYVANLIGEQYVIPTLGVWDSPKEIDFDSLPDQFVLKWNHDSGSVIICRDKSCLDKTAIVQKLSGREKYNGYYYGREWPYKNVKPRILAEQYMQDGQNKNLPVYKIFNFNGEPRIIQVIQDDKTQNETIDYFDTDWQLLDMKQTFPNSVAPMQRPAHLDEMLELSRKLSAGFPFIRIDLYEICGKLYFSEYTFYSDAGFGKFRPEHWDHLLGSWIHISELDHPSDSV